MSVILCCLKILCRQRHKTPARYSDYDVPDEEDAEVSSLFPEVPQSDVYSVPHTCDPYAAFDPDVSAASEDDNHEQSESGSAQRGFKKIGEQWGAMVTSHSSDRGRAHKDSRVRYSKEKSARKDTSSRHDQYKNRSGWTRRDAARTPSRESPELSVQDQAVGTTPRVMRLVSEEVQTAAEDPGPSPEVAVENGLTSGDGVLHSAASSNKDMVDREVQCLATDFIKQEYMRLTLLCHCSGLLIYSGVVVQFNDVHTYSYCDQHLAVGNFYHLVQVSQTCCMRPAKTLY